MDLELAARVRASIAEQARAEGGRAGIQQVCQACMTDLDCDGVNVCLRGPDETDELLFATGPRAAELAELQITFGEGPGRDAQAQGRPMLVPDLAAGATQRRWPMWASSARPLGVAACFAIPMQVGVIAVGTLTIVNSKPGWLTPPQLAMGLLYADAALVVALAIDLTGDPPGPDPRGNGFVDRWAQVHQATGMISAQLATSVSEAFVRLRAHAFASGRPLTRVADDVVARRLRFTSDGGPGVERASPPG